MIGLLRKDLFVADKSSRLLLVLALLFSLIPSFDMLGSTYAMMLAFMVPLNSIAFDEKCKWDRYAAMLPCTAGQIVWSKYLLGYIYTLLGEAIIFLSPLLRQVFTHKSVDWAETFRMNVMLAVVMMVMMSLGLPALYRFGSEKGRLVMFLVLAVGVGTAVAVTKALIGDIRITLPPFPVMACIAAAAVIAVTYLSFRMSMWFYRKRQNGAYC